jgi:type IV pilus assembly protein PilE
LIEVLIVVVIVGIIAAIAYPAYQDQVRKSRRSEAKAALMDTAARMEKYYLDRKTYDAADMTALGFGSSTLLTPNGYYIVSIVDADTSSTTYKIRAQAQSKGGQNEDTPCTSMWIDERGRKTPAGCW